MHVIVNGDRHDRQQVKKVDISIIMDFWGLEGSRLDALLRELKESNHLVIIPEKGSKRGTEFVFRPMQVNDPEVKVLTVHDG